MITTVSEKQSLLSVFSVDIHTRSSFEVVTEQSCFVTRDSIKVDGTFFNFVLPDILTNIDVEISTLNVSLNFTSFRKIRLTINKDFCIAKLEVTIPPER